MTGFQPTVPMTGYSGWRFLQRTVESQQTAFANSAQISRDIEYFRENIGTIQSAKELVSDFRLLKVALGAFGLDDDIGKKAYILKALEEGTDDKQSFANRMVDKRYQEFSKAFGFGNLLGTRTNQSNFAEQIIAPYQVRQFEIAIGNSDQSMRLAMSFTREISAFANSANPDSTAWFEVMGNPPIRQIFETAFGLPESFGTLNVDKQREVLREKSAQLFGDSSLAVFTDPGNVKKLLQTFFARQQLAAGPSIATSGSAALAILQNTASGMAGLFQSRL